ncbi:coiled-coil domain-containing protein 169-like isoform X2 [Octopus sinensis]|uniref:Coiled-coil domain-containing protein 169-like isoform X2 n=1 Tax=Octopus sinensis TaxID=2607531 RepID=A0A7E6F9H3_9MOLL|nr:coiled-coil domain-containing protein 169-like isoform X2 [Octopus sinensis]
MNKTNMAMAIVGEFEIERINTKIKQEKQMKDMLDNSLQELITTVKELEQRSETIQDEGNEWRTRFETQEEINKQLQQQDLVLTKKVDEARSNLKEAMKKPKDNNSTQDNTEITPQYVKILEKEKNSLANQLRDLEWRLDQESKAYHKANDERKQYILEINITKSTLEDLKMKQRYNNITSHYAHNYAMAAQMNQQNDQLHSPRQQRDEDGPKAVVMLGHCQLRYTFKHGILLT